MERRLSYRTLIGPDAILSWQANSKAPAPFFILRAFGLRKGVAALLLAGSQSADVIFLKHIHNKILKA